MAEPQGTPTRVERVFRRSESNPTRGTSAPSITEWAPSYAAEYPHNNVTQTDSGHLMEMDDTPGAERVHLYHRSGSHIEMRPDGSVKYSVKQNRQDVTIADHEIIVNGDFKLSVAGNINIRVRDGEFQIQADNGMAINVKGQLKVSADEINLRAKNKIVLASPNVDIGGVGPNASIPLISLPTGIVPMFGVILPRITGVSTPASILQAATPPQVPSSLSENVGMGNIIDKFKSVVSITASLAKQMSAISAYGGAVSLGVGLAKQLSDKDGKSVVAEIPQPEEVPLSNPRVYNGIDFNRKAFRERLFDDPAEVQNVSAYVAHLNFMEDLGDFSGDIKELPGEPNTDLVDVTPPGQEPPPWSAYDDRGRVTFQRGETLVVGTDTRFSEDYAIGTYLTFAEAPWSRIDGIQQFPRVRLVVNNTALYLADPYPGTTAQNVIPQSFRYRKFSEYMNRSEFVVTDSLGSSGYALGDVLVNYVPPVFEPDDLPVVTSSPGGTSVGGTQSPLPSDSER